MKHLVTFDLDVPINGKEQIAVLLEQSNQWVLHELADAARV